MIIKTLYPAGNDSILHFLQLTIFQLLIFINVYIYTGIYIFMNIYQGYKILISFSVCEIHDSEKVFDLTTRKSTSSQQQGYRKTCLPKVFTYII